MRISQARLERMKAKAPEAKAAASRVSEEERIRMTAEAVVKAMRSNRKSTSFDFAISRDANDLISAVTATPSEGGEPFAFSIVRDERGCISAITAREGRGAQAMAFKFDISHGSDGRIASITAHGGDDA